MAKGPIPKDPRDRARRNKPTIPYRIITASPSPQPPLPATMPDGEPWPEQTRKWWAMWRDSPFSADFHATDWSFLLDTAVLHAMFWRGNTKVAGELRIRVAKHGITPGDRARLRTTYANTPHYDPVTRTWRKD
jgi:hypothetical protein